MKIKSLSLLCTLLCSFFVNAQKDPVVLDDFESGEITFTAVITVNPPTDMKIEVANNPGKNMVNESDKVLAFERTGITQKWAGFWANLKTVQKDYKYLHIKYFRTDARSKIRINVKPLNGTNNEFLPMNEPSKINEWENLIFDLSGHNANEIGTIGIQPDFADDREIGRKVYIDDIILSDTEIISDKFIDQKVIGLVSKDLQPNALTLNWSHLKNAVSYDVYKEGVLYRSNVAGNSVTVSGLKSFDIYYFTVKAKDVEGNYSKESEPLYVASPETKEQKDNRMAWWREARFGMFIHWGVYAKFAGYYNGPSLNSNLKKPYYSCYLPDMVDESGNIKTDPSTGQPYQRGQYAEWIMFAAQIPRDEYLKEAEGFTADKFNAKEWVSAAKNAGMKYIIITSKHHDGFSLMWNVPGRGIQNDSPIDKDILAELVNEARSAGLKIGFYYSQALDWLNPGGMGWIPQNTEYADRRAPYEKRLEYVNNTVIPHLEKMIKDYRVDVIWWDMGGDSSPELKYRTMKAIKNIPGTENLIFNNRLEDHLTSDFSTPEQSIPNISATGNGTDWETCMTMNDNWGYCAHDHRWKSADDLLLKLIDITSKGGNFLLNIGPKADGAFPQESIDRLNAVGEWMKINGEAVWGTTANPFTNPPTWGKVTKKVASDEKTTLYFHVLNWPTDGKLTCNITELPKNISVLGSNVVLQTSLDNGILTISGFPSMGVHPVATVIKMEFDTLPVEDASIRPDTRGAFNLNPENYQSVTGLIVEKEPKNFGSWASSTGGVVPGKSITWLINAPENKEYKIGIEYMAVEDGILNLKFNEQPIQCNYANSSDYITKEFPETVTLPLGTCAVEVTRTSTVNKWNYINLRSISLSPNDVSSVNSAKKDFQIQIKSDGIVVNNLAKGELISLYDIMGKLVSAKKVSQTEEYIPLKENNISMMMLRITSNDHVETIKILSK